jgi:hypothetical protein
VTCQSCGHQIADTAIVCYRCGTPTAVPAVVRPPAPAAPPGRRWGMVVAIIVVVVLVALAVGLARHLL